MAGVNVQMGVSGIGQFKQNINTAKNSLKTLDAQLSLTEKQFQATGDKETYMQEKTELLKVKLEEQKAIASQAEQALAQMASNGVDKASKAYQDMQQQLLKAKADMLDTESQLSGVGEASDEAANGVSEMNAQLKRVGQGVAWENVTEGMGKITSGIEGAIKKAWKLGEAIVNATLGAGSWADEIATTAAQYEDTLLGFGGGDSATEALQRMRKTASIIDTDVDTILNAQDKLKKGREKGDKETMGALAYLGVDPTGKSDIDVFWEAGEALASLGKEEDKVAYAQKLFGKSWRELLPLFTAGREEYDETMKSWSVVSDEALDGLGKMDDQYQKMQAEFETFKNELLSAFSGPLTEGMETITGLFQELNKYLQTPEGKEMLKQMGDTISSLISDLTDINPEDVIASLKGIIDGIVESLKWIDEHQNDVKTALGVIGTAFAGLKIIEIGANIGRVVSGFQQIKDMFGGGKNSTPAVEPTTTTTATSGGWFTALANKATELGGKAGNVLAQGGNFFPVLGDWLFNSSPIAPVLHGVESWGDLWERVKAEQQERTETFLPNWDANNPEANVLAQLGRNNILFWDNQLKTNQAASEWVLPDDMSIEEQLAWVAEHSAALDDSVDRMESVADENGESAGKVDDAGEKIEGAAKDMSKLPEDTAAAVQKALNGSRVVIDGGALTAVVGQYMAGLVAQYVK